jgi:hypothetical protein
MTMSYGPCLDRSVAVSFLLGGFEQELHAGPRRRFRKPSIAGAEK